MYEEEKDLVVHEKLPKLDNTSETAMGWRGFLARYRQQIQGFIGWYLIATVISSGGLFGLITTPVTLVALIAYANSKKSKGVAGGILIAIALNFFISLLRGLSLNAWCLVPFYTNY